MSGPFGAGGLQLFSGAKGFYPHEIGQSIRYAAVDTPALTWTPGSTSNRRTFTISCWLKRGLTGEHTPIFTSGANNQNYFKFVISSDDFLRVMQTESNSYKEYFVSDAVLRDTSAWYNFVCRVDTTQGTAANRIRVYQNGTLMTGTNTATISQNHDTYVNYNVLEVVGASTVNSEYTDGYYADFNKIDGTSLGPDSFGETKSGIWVPIDTSGLTFGTHGFRLQFDDKSSNDALGTDSSGNGNDLVSTGYGLVAGHDFVKDSPTNNFAVLKKNSTPSSGTLSQANLEFTSGTGDSARNMDRQCSSTILIPTSGKWYCEVLPLATTSTFIGVAPHQEGRIDHASNNNRYAYFYPVGDGGSNGQIYIRTGASETISNYGAPTGTSDVIGIFLDMDESTPRLYFSKNGQWASGSNWNQSNPTDYVELGDSFFTTDSDSGQAVFNAARAGGSTSIGPVFNFGQDGGAFRGQKGQGSETDSNGRGLFKYAVPSGGLALCTANLPDPGIDPAGRESSADYFNTVLYSGTGSSQSVTGVGFAPDFVWIKERSSSSGHSLHDTVRGTNKRLDSSSGNDESASGVTAFGADGFTEDGGGATGESSQTYVSWNWLAGGSASTLSDGSINVSASVSAESGFSILSYTGNATNGATIAHGLNSRPELVIFKNRSRDSRNWQANFIDGTARRSVYLNLTSAESTPGSQQTLPTDTLITLDAGNDSNQSGDDIVAYCFANVEGYQKIGQYTGNGNDDGPFINVGFRPAWVMVKRTDSTNNWFIFDSVREPSNPNDASFAFLRANISDAEASNVKFEFNSTAFKPRDGSAGFNADGGTYLYLAIAEQPFKFANARQE